MPNLWTASENAFFIQTIKDLSSVLAEKRRYINKEGGRVYLNKKWDPVIQAMKAEQVKHHAGGELYSDYWPPRTYTGKNIYHKYIALCKKQEEREKKDELASANEPILELLDGEALREIEEELERMRAERNEDNSVVHTTRDYSQGPWLLCEPVQFEPVQSDPALFDPAQFDPALIDPALLDPAQLDPAQLDPALFEPIQFEPIQFEPIPSEPIQFSNWDPYHNTF